MSVCSAIFSIFVLGFTHGNAYSDLDRCQYKGDSGSVVYKYQFCKITRNSVNLACPGNKKIVMVSPQFALKTAIDECTKRILNSDDSFCCAPLPNDIIYDAECLKNVWNPEDMQHYRQFMLDVLQKCNNKKKCTLHENMFINLQLEIPDTRRFSSYIQINHQCISAPTKVIDMCSTGTVMGKEIHFQDTLMSSGQVNETCTCRVNSGGNGKVTVEAVDVRTANSGLILRAGNTIKDLSNINQPLFGLKDMISEREIDITIVKRTNNAVDNMWMQLRGTNGQDISVTCEGQHHETSVRPTKLTTRAMRTTTLPDIDHGASDIQQVVADPEEEDLGEYWPMIYLGAGSGITIVLVACVLGSFLICKYSMKKSKRESQYGNPYRHSQVNYNRSGQYDTVLDDMQHIPGHMVASNQETLEWR